MLLLYLQILFYKIGIANNPIGGNNINNEVPILFLIPPNKPNNVNNGTIRISAPAPTKPAAIPLMIPVIVNPRNNSLNIID